MTSTIAILGVIWLAGVLCSVCAMSVVFVLQRRIWLPSLLAVVGLLIGVMGLSGRTPLGRLPEVGYSWSNDFFLISMRLGSAFILPVVLAIVALAIIFIRTRKRMYGA